MYSVLILFHSQKHCASRASSPGPRPELLRRLLGRRRQGGPAPPRGAGAGAGSGGSGAVGGGAEGHGGHGGASCAEAKFCRWSVDIDRNLMKFDDILVQWSFYNDFECYTTILHML